MLIPAASDGELNYNRIIPIQLLSSTARVSNDFATLKCYGKTDPRFTDNETPDRQLTTAQKNLGFTSTTIEGGGGRPLLRQERLPETGRRQGPRGRPDFALTPTRPQRLAADGFVPGRGLHRLHDRFDDDNKITVEVPAGRHPRFRLNSKDITIDLRPVYYDIKRGVPLWKVTISSSQKANPTTANTRVRIICGSLHANLCQQQPHLPRQFLHPPPAGGRGGLLRRE